MFYRDEGTGEGNPQGITLFVGLALGELKTSPLLGLYGQREGTVTGGVVAPTGVVVFGRGIQPTPVHPAGRDVGK